MVSGSLVDDTKAGVTAGEVARVSGGRFWKDVGEPPWKAVSKLGKSLVLGFLKRSFPIWLDR